MDNIDYDVLINEINSIQATPEKIQKAWNDREKYSKVITSQYELDSIDKTICFASGVLAAGVDMFLVTDVRKLSTDNPIGFKADKLKNTGKVNSFVDQRIKNIYSPEQIKVLESEYWVPYDASNNSEVGIPIKGMNMLNHRMHTPGHDPILGFYYGVRDILRGQLTSIGIDGSIITQSRILPQGYHVTLLQAIGRQFGHLASDISTEQGLPIPFMGQLLRFTSPSGINDKTIGELADYMYKYGYNFNHLLSMSVPSIMIELIKVGSKNSIFCS